MGDKAAGVVEEWTRRALAELAKVNRGVLDTLERMHEGEDLVIDEAFGAMTQAERDDIEKDRREVEALETKSLNEPKASSYSDAVLAWIHRKAWGR
jgi:hypothetical protein